MKLRNKRTGEIGYFCFANWDSPVLIIMDENGVQLAKYNSLAELNSEFEDYEEPKKYWYMDYGGRIKAINDANDEEDVARKEIGNYFDTREEAEQAVKRLRAWKRLKDKNFHFLKYSALGCGEIEFSLDFEDMDDEGEIGELRYNLDLLFGGEE